MADEREVLVEVKNLEVTYGSGRKAYKAVKNANFTIYKGETFGLVGESGSGKTTIGRAIMRILPTSGGEVFYKGQKINGKISHALDKQVIKEIQMIFQDPQSSLNERAKVSYIVGEGLMNVRPDLSAAERDEKVRQALLDVGLLPEFASRFPHEFSGGQRQRIGIARALIVEPEFIIADEPTTALDVTIQAQILDLLRNLKDQINSSIMFITHDLGVIAEMADYVVVMYAGRIVEQGTAEEIFAHPAHPYTIGLMASKPVVGRQVDKLYSIPGKVPNPINMPNYCYFKDRCEMCVNGCEGDYPCEVSISPTHKVSCYRYYDGKRPDLEEVVEEELAEGKENGKEGE